ncbi:MAG: hypothetical protein R3255_02570 [Candidatus Lokiarchaeia archaeon]|nr:hypothetical protein [Candidatus Lokiarchaeia archaeon]
MGTLRRKSILLGISITIITISGIFTILSSFQIITQQSIIEEQKTIIDENRHWAEKITFWEVTGGLGEDIIEGEKLYYEALAKYSAAVQAQNLAIFAIIIFSIIILITIGSLIIKIP